MIEERLRRSVVDGPSAHDEDAVAWRIVAFLTWWRTWLGAAVIVASFFVSFWIAAQFGPQALMVAWFGGFLTHAAIGPVMDA